MSVAVHWEPTLWEHNPWQETPEEVQALGISQYRFLDNEGRIDYYRYTLCFTNTKGWSFTFTDETGEKYTCSTMANGDHEVSFDSGSPTIVAVE